MKVSVFECIQYLASFGPVLIGRLCAVSPTFMVYQGGGEGGVCKVYCRHEREKGEERTVKILQNLAECLCKVNAGK